MSLSRESPRHPSSVTRVQEKESALSLLLSHGNGDIICAFLAALKPHTAAILSRVCRDWARAAEYCLQPACQALRWSLPRRARLQQRGVLAELPWRSLFISKACRACLTKPGDFAARTPDAGAPRFFLCAACAKSARVVERLQRSNFTLDVTGLSGKPLFTAKESRFCAEVSKLSKEAQDNASGARAEVLRKAGRR